MPETTEAGDQTPQEPEKKDDLNWHERAKAELEARKNELVKSVVEKFTDARGKTQEGGTLGQELAQEATDEPSLADNDTLYWNMIGVYAALQTGLVLCSFFFGLYRMTWSFDGHLTINIGLSVGILQITHLLSSLRSVDIDELAGILFFGRPTIKPRSGLWCVPFGLLTLVREKRPIRDFLFPGPQENIYRLTVKQAEEKPEEAENIPAAMLGEGGRKMVKPIFITTGKPRGEPDEEDTLDKQFTVDVSWFIQLRMSNSFGGIFRVYRNMGRGEDAWQKAENLIKEQGLKALRGILTTLTPATIIANERLVSEIFKLTLTEIMMRRGFQVLDGGLTDFNLSHDTNTLLQEAQTRAPLRRRATITEAEGERAKLTLKGEGAANATRLELEAQGKGLKSIMKDAEVDGSAVLASETAKAVLAKANAFVIGTDGLQQLFGLVKAGKDALAITTARPVQPTDENEERR